MIIYPDIEIHKGQCVNLKHGSIADPKIFDISPLDAAKEFENAGAEWLHIIDMDSVFATETRNTDLICEIIQQSHIPVQVGGGIRAASVIDGWINHGAQRVILGTAAVSDPRLVEQTCVHHPGKILISIDARDHKAVSHGWQHVSTFTALELAQRFENLDIAGIIYTDIDLYDELPESSMANTTNMAVTLNCPVISSGTVQSLDNVSMLSQLPNIAGVVIGWALFNHAVTLEEALQVAKQKTTEAKMI